MNEQLTLRWHQDVLGQFSFRKRLLAWDSFEAHLTDEVKKALAMQKSRPSLFRGAVPSTFKPQMFPGISHSRGRFKNTTTTGLLMESTNIQMLAI